MRATDAPLILVADSDARASEALAGALRAEGLQVVICRHAATAVDAVAFHRPSVIVVDVSMDDGHGWDVATAARAHGNLPTIVIDRENDVAVRRAAYAAGADDVVVASLDPIEFATRVHALARRARPETRTGQVLRHRDLVMDVAAHEVRIAGRQVVLTAQQFGLLRVILEAGGATLDRAQLIARTDSLDAEPPSDRAIDLHITRLRHRLGDDPRTPRYVEAVYGVGYRLAHDDQPGPDGFGDHAVAVLDALPDAVLVVDRSLKLRFANLAAEHLFGVPRASLGGRHCGDLLECRSCGGAQLDGPRCIGRAVLGGLGQVHDAPAVVSGPDGPFAVSLSYGHVEVGNGESLVTITVRRREDATL